MAYKTDVLSTIYEKVMEHAQKHPHELVVFYPASGFDVEGPLKATGAKKYVFVDQNDMYGHIQSAIRKLGGAITHAEKAGHRSVVRFEYGGEEREIQFHQENLANHTPGEFDVYFEVAAESHSGSQRNKLLERVPVGGFVIADTSVGEMPPEMYGFGKIGEYKDFCEFENKRLHVLQKTEQRPIDTLEGIHGNVKAVQSYQDQLSTKDKQDIFDSIQKDVDALPDSAQKDMRTYLSELTQ